MTHIAFNVPGKPVGWQRAGRNGRRYFTRPETARYQEEIRYEFLQSSKDICEPFLDAAYVAVKILACFAPPQSWSKKRREQAQFRPYPQKPDADNISKTVLDALNGIAWTDDKKVYDLRIIKEYCNVEGILVDISFWDGI